jgi:hypothetical protein
MCVSNVLNALLFFVLNAEPISKFLEALDMSDGSYDGKIDVKELKDGMVGRCD